MKTSRIDRWLNILSSIAIVSAILYGLSFLFPNLARQIGQVTKFRDIAIGSEEAVLLGEELLPAVVLL